MRHVVAALVAAVLAAGCASDGTTLRPPPPGATAPSLTSSTLNNTPFTVSQPMTLASPSFVADGPIPIENSCDGANTSPPLSWGGVPEGTVELAITVFDPDAPGGVVHWVVALIDPTVQAIDAGDVPAGAVQARNDAGATGWTGPCPPQGPPHHYVFTLYALTSPSGVLDTMTGKEAIATLDQAAGVTTRLTGTYQRAG